MGPAGVVVAMAVSVATLLPTGGGGGADERATQAAPAPAATPATGSESTGGQGSAGTAAVVPGAAERLLALVNAERQAAGLPPLARHPAIAAIAEAHSLAMAARGELFHNDGYFSTSVRREIGAAALGENVAVNGDLDDAHRRLMASPHHRANVLDPRFSAAGFAVVATPEGALFVTEDFAELRVPAAPARPPRVLARAGAAGTGADPAPVSSAPALRLVPLAPSPPVRPDATGPGALLAVLVVLAAGIVLPVGTGLAPAPVRDRRRGA